MKLNKKGFSLVELMITVSLIGIISAIAIPSYLGVQKKGKRSEKDTYLQILKLCEEKWHAERGVYKVDEDTASTQAMLDANVFPEFRPGDPDNLIYDYSITGGAQNFWITAAGRADTIEEGKKFCINELNEKLYDDDCP